MPFAAVLLAALLPLLGEVDPAQAAGWRRPLDGDVVGAFAYDREAPFDRGRRRGIDLAAPPGTPVRAACGGAVTFAGRAPAGRGVSLRCGALVATHLGLGAIAVRRGVRVRVGAVLGALGPAGVLRLGARRARDRLGYVDPARLLTAGPPQPPALGPAPRAPRRPPAPPRPSSPRMPAPPMPAPSAHAPGTATPLAVWLGLAGVTGALAGGTARARRRRRPRAAPRARGATVVLPWRRSP
ncbi:MAG TPA: M23 family metallopeptidase [Baekduia sp.]|nr:M23 family metallopeptidase [Baekduia sp.]